MRPYAITWAAWTTTSRRPNSATASSTAARIPSSSVTSAGRMRAACAPAASASAAVSSRDAGPRATRMRRAPRTDSSMTVARPMPLEAPVTRTVCGLAGSVGVGTGSAPRAGSGRWTRPPSRRPRRATRAPTPSCGWCTTDLLEHPEEPAGPGHRGARRQPPAQSPVGGDDEEGAASGREPGGVLRERVVPAAGRPLHPHTLGSGDVPGTALHHGHDLVADDGRTVRPGERPPRERGEAAEQPGGSAGAGTPPAVRGGGGEGRAATRARPGGGGGAGAGGRGREHGGPPPPPPLGCGLGSPGRAA